MAWSAHKNAVVLLESMKDQNLAVWALERTVDSEPIHSVLKSQDLPEKILLVVGNEISGIDPGILELASRTVHIPMQGRKRSFNVAVAFSLAAQILRSQRELN